MKVRQAQVFIFGILIFSMIQVKAESMPPYLFQGAYQFQGQVEAVRRRTVDVIDRRQSDANQRIQTLKQQGAQCRTVDSVTVACQSVLPGNQIPPHIVEMIRQKERQKILNFGPEWAPPSLVSESESFIEWKMNQKVIWPKGTVDSYRYLFLTPHLVKIVLSSPQETLWLYSTKPGVLRQMHFVPTTESRWRFHEDMLESLLLRSF